MEPQYRFCTSSDGTRIAYATYGNGPPLLFANTFVLSIDAQFRWPEARAFFDAIAAHATLVIFDRRGTGASARDVEDLSDEVEALDIATVANASGLESFPLFADATAGAAAACFASRTPKRVQHLILWAPWTSLPEDPFDQEQLAAMRRDWSYWRRMWASRIYPEGPVSLQKSGSQALKQTLSPEMAVRRFGAVRDLRRFAPEVKSPTLALQREEWTGPFRRPGIEVTGLFPMGEMQFVPGFAATPYPEHEAIVEATLQFFGIATAAPPDNDVFSGTAIILFADIVDSTALTERLGDTPFRDKARDLDTALRNIIREAGGTPVEGKLLGDGVLAVFSSARQAIDAALKCGTAGEQGGFPLHLGLHAGDVIEEDGNVFGGAVNIAARIAGESAPGEVLVSGTVRELARTSAGVGFEDAGERKLKGVGEAVRVWAVVEAE